MATLVLPFVTYKEVTPLPPVCIRCEKPATRTIKMQFSGKTTRFVGIRIYAPGGKDEYVLVDTPVCDGHPFMGQAKWIMKRRQLVIRPGRAPLRVAANHSAEQGKKLFGGYVRVRKRKEG